MCYISQLIFSSEYLPDNNIDNYITTFLSVVKKININLTLMDTFICIQTFWLIAT